MLQNVVEIKCFATDIKISEKELVYKIETGSS